MFSTAGVTAAFGMMLQTNLYLVTLKRSIDTIEYIPEAVVSEMQEDPYCGLSEEDFELFACCVEAEAGDQGYLGKCYVVDCILNRADQWNKTIREVIFQPHQFEVVSNRRIYKMHPPDETYQAIRDEMRSRTRSDILYFRMSHYHEFGTPLFHYKDHWFSK